MEARLEKIELHLARIEALVQVSNELIQENIRLRQQGNDPVHIPTPVFPTPKRDCKLRISSDQGITRITGNTYECRELLKKHAATWDGPTKSWIITSSGDKDELIKSLESENIDFVTTEVEPATDEVVFTSEVECPF